METRFLFTSNRGDVDIDKEMMEGPFMIRPMEAHQFLTLGDFFNGIEKFILADEGEMLVGLLKYSHDVELSPADIERVIIRYEKYGTLYHIVSIEVHARNFHVKLALSAAHSSDAKSTLEKEFHIIEKLHDRFNLPYIPRIFRKGPMEFRKDGNKESFLVVVSEWFEDYHEWHFSGDHEKTKEAEIWDMVRGFRPLKTDEIKGIIHGASKILTLYYDIETNHGITHWHHGAGDFIVKISNSNMDIRLISVRQYGPIKRIGKEEAVDALIDFLLYNSVRMRLDKYEGMGSPLWADAFILESLLKGFFKGLEQKEKEGTLHPLNPGAIFGKLREFHERELWNRLTRLFMDYSESDPLDYACVEKHLETHTRQLYHIFQTFKLR